MGAQGEHLEDLVAIGRGRCQDLAVRADRRPHELAVLGDQTLTDRLDHLVVGDLQAVLVLAAHVALAPEGAIGGTDGRRRPQREDECSRDTDGDVTAPMGRLGGVLLGLVGRFVSVGLGHALCLSAATAPRMLLCS